MRQLTVQLSHLSLTEIYGNLLQDLVKQNPNVFFFTEIDT